MKRCEVICAYCRTKQGMLSIPKEVIKYENEIILDGEPCNECSNKFNKGVVILEEGEYNTDIRLENNVYITGNYIVLTKIAAKKILKLQNMSIEKGDMAVLSKEDFKHMQESLNRKGE